MNFFNLIESSNSIMIPGIDLMLFSSLSQSLIYCLTLAGTKSYEPPMIYKVAPLFSKPAPPLNPPMPDYYLAELNPKSSEIDFYFSSYSLF
jgi:hypothetical protein